jgi:hypothetical protein
MIDVRQTAAYRNQFFERASEGTDVEGLRELCLEWYPITQAFCVALPGYVGVFASEAARAEGAARDALEEAFLAPLAIAAGEFGMGLHGTDGIHYRMFARLAGPLGIPLSELRQRPRGTLPQTARLVDAIRDSLTDLYRGAGCIRVVEGTAYNIVEAMDRLFRPHVGLDSRPAFSEHEMEYITLHLELEKEHDCMAADFVDVLCDDPEQAERVDAAIVELANLFSEYWEAVAERVYSPAALAV